MHKDQKNIIRNLIYSPSLSFAKLNSSNISSDRFNFHLKQLIKSGYVLKQDNGLYTLTEQGKEVSLRVDGLSKEVSKQGVIGVVVLPVRDKKGNKEYLIQKRLKSPFYGVYGFVSGKVDMCEYVNRCAKRELKEETGLYGGALRFLGIHHSIKGYKKTHPIIDHYFYLFRVDNPTGRIIDTKEGSNVWLSDSEIKDLKPTFPDFDFTFNTFKENKNIGFVEKFYKLNNF